MKEELKKKIEEFWEWFSNNEKHIKEVLTDDFHEGRKSLTRNMDNQVLQFGMFTWEMGPVDDQKTFFLTISPNGNEELLELSKDIIALSPALSDWKFYYAKPAKVWDLRFSVFDDFMEEHKLDASDWKFICQNVSGKKAQITIKASNLSHLDEETKMTAGDLVVTSLLGEAFKIYNIDKISVVNDFEIHQKSDARPIFDLKKEFK